MYERGGNHSRQAHFRHIRRRTEHSDAFSGGARPGGRFYFEQGAELTTPMQFSGSNGIFR